MLHGTYTTWLVIVSIVIAIAVAYVAIDMARRLAAAQTRLWRGWLAGGAVALGAGIWATHFIGMLAFHLPVAMGFDLGITLLSFVAALAGSALALWIATRRRLPFAPLALGAAVLGGGVCGMHYAGMAAMRMQPAIIYTPSLVALSIGVAVVVSGFGLYLIHALCQAHHRMRWLQLSAALVFGVGIAAVHYIGMAAASFPLGSASVAAAYGMPVNMLAGLVILGTLGVLGLALLASLLGRYVELRTAALSASLATANHELARSVLRDPLTGLPNRSLLEDRLAEAIGPGVRFALVFIDLDGFKAVNGTLGYHVGDLVLAELARRLGAACRQADILSRLAGDEFVILAPVGARADAQPLAQRVLELVRQPVLVAAGPVRVSASLGVALYPEDGNDPASLLANAEAAMHDAKENGRNGYRFFEPVMNAGTRVLQRLMLGLGQALERREFYLLYQPKYDAATSTLIGVEALVRWQHPEQGLVGPDVFIPLAERSGVIVELGAWILDEACRQVAAWRRQGLMLKMSVNLSVLQFCSTQLVGDVATCLEKYALPAQCLILEVTESTAMQDVEHSLRMLGQLRELGVKISIDDFGTGYSSLAYLKRLRASELKIDRSFVQNLDQGHEDTAIVAAIIALGKTLGMVVTAEGVETEAQREFLVRHGCDLLQGYLLSRPVQAKVVAAVASARAEPPSGLLARNSKRGEQVLRA